MLVLRVSIDSVMSASAAIAATSSLSSALGASISVLLVKGQCYYSSGVAVSDVV